MFNYEKRLEYPIHIKETNPRLAKAIISQYGGPDGELGASMRYLSQRYTMPYKECAALLTDIGTEELGHFEMIATIVHQLTRNMSMEDLRAAGFDDYYVDHTLGLWPQAASGMPFSASMFQSTGDPITDLSEDQAAEQKARTTYDNILRLSVDSPDVTDAIRFLRANAAFYHIDPERVAVWGDSSGGHAALMVGVTGDLPEFKTEDCAEYSDAVNAVLDFYGPTDVTRINDAPRNPVYTADKENIPEDLLFGGCVIDHPEIAQPGNPLNYITAEKDLPPILIVHGDWDSMVPFQQSVLIYKKLMECGKTAEFYKVYGAEHGTCLWTPEVLKTAEQFLGIYLS